jgi:nucleotide-binding universal stress UspA family protein
VLAVVVESPGMRMAEGAQPGAIAYQQESYRAVLEEAVTGLRKYGLNLESRLVCGEPAQEIAAYARQVRADLVVVGHRKQSLLQRWWSGPSGAYLSDYLSCSLLIARTEVPLEDFLAELQEVTGVIPAAAEPASAAGG